MEYIIKILIIENDVNNQLFIEKCLSSFSNNITIIKEKSLQNASNIVIKEKPNIIVCKNKLPDGSGIELLKKIRTNNELKDIYFIILASTDDNEIINNAIQLNLDDYIRFPFETDQFAIRINTAIKYQQLFLQAQNENSLLYQIAEELEKELQDIIKLSVKFLQARIPSSYDLLKRVASASVWIAQSYGNLSNEEIHDVEISAFLSQAGRIFLPDNLLKVPVMTGGVPTDPIMYQVPISGSEIVSTVRRFKDIANYIKHIYENFDGSGIPDRLQSWQIPYASRIIRVALDYEEYKLFQNKSASAAIQLINRDSQRLYDNRVVILMEQYVKSNEKELKIDNEVALNLIELKAGMTTTRDIYTEKGLKLIPAGTKLNESIINKIINIATTDTILGNVYVRI